MHVIGFLIQHVYRSLFLTGETGFRNTYSLVKIVFIATTLYCFLPLNLLTTFYLLILFSILGLIDKGVKWIISTYTLSSIPSIWYGLSTLLLSIIGYIPYTPPLNIGFIILRTFTFSTMILFYASIISPTRIYNILYKLGLEKQAVIPLLTWRLIPYGLTNMVESLAIGKLKNEGIRERLPPAIASMIELGEMVRESAYYKIYVKPRHCLPVENTIVSNIVLLISTLTSLAIALL